MWLLLLSTLCHAPLMTSPEDCQALVVQKEKAFQTDPRCLYLAGIIYTSPQSWVIWINDQKWTPEHLPEGYIIHSVRASAVKLVIKGKRITLQIHQSYSPRADAVLDGDLRKSK